MQIGIEFIGAVGIIGDNVVFDPGNDRGKRTAGSVSRKITADQVTVNGKQRRGFLPGRVEMEKSRIKCIQQEMVGIIRYDERRGKGKSRRHHVDVDVLESVRAGIGMGNHRRDDVIEQKGTGTIGTIYEFPAFVGMPGYGVNDSMFADIGDVVHADSFQIHDS